MRIWSELLSSDFTLHKNNYTAVFTVAFANVWLLLHIYVCIYICIYGHMSVEAASRRLDMPQLFTTLLIEAGSLADPWHCPIMGRLISTLIPRTLCLPSDTVPAQVLCVFVRPKLYSLYLWGLHFVHSKYLPRSRTTEILSKFEHEENDSPYENVNVFFQSI